MKKQKIEITQENGIIRVYRNGELDYQWYLNDAVEGIRQGRMNEIQLANIVAEMLCDSLNCKSASASVKDLNDTKSYRGTYFESIDYFAKNNL